ncbi:MAG: ferritin family protein [Sulfurospirillaceae bacterium]|nr:ferritin family protein [Sulfurospirillaceae bacterium]
MNAYEYAMQIEKEGEKYYRELAENVDDVGLKKIFTMLANEEVKHYVAFEKMNKNQKIEPLEVVDVFEKAKNIFRNAKDENKLTAFSDEQIKYYTKALQAEENSFRFYTEKAKEMKDETQKNAFLAIAEEERQHAVLIENIIEYVNDPQSWIENAEFPQRNF